MTFATRDLSHIMLHNNGKLLKGEIAAAYPKEALEYYSREQIHLLRSSFEAAAYDEPLDLNGFAGHSSVKASFHWSGHILGSAGIALENRGFRIVHTGDVQFEHQKVIQRARLPRVHADVVITEATNCAKDVQIDYAGETRRLGAFINAVTSEGGSILIPCFALGKTQEILARFHGLIRKGSIPNLPLYTGGMGVQVSKVYDEYCYTEPMRVPGFEVSDIPQNPLKWEDLTKAEYFSKPSIVIAPSGMMNKRTMSFVLAKHWMQQPRFGIGFIGYQDPSTPGYQLLHSERNTPFDFGGKNVFRSCAVDKFRFSAHAALEGLVDYIVDVRPKTVVVVHGEPDACDGLALALRQRMPGLRVIIPRQGVGYDLASAQASTDASQSVRQDLQV
jgi:Cft2 family RNA processing exonuclease